MERVMKRNRKSYKAGMNGHLSKPVSVDKLLETIRRILK